MPGLHRPLRMQHRKLLCWFGSRPLDQNSQWLSNENYRSQDNTSFFFFSIHLLSALVDSKKKKKRTKSWKRNRAKNNRKLVSSILSVQSITKSVIRLNLKNSALEPWNVTKFHYFFFVYFNTRLYTLSDILHER